MTNKIKLLVLAMFFCSPAWASSEALRRDPNKVPAAGGVTNDSDMEVKNLRVDPTSNRLLVESVDKVGSIQTFLVDIPNAGATSRVQLPSASVNTCTFQGKSGNAGSVYLGGSDVTNASGAKEGVSLPYSNLTIPGGNLNVIYVAADNAGDDVKILCN